MRESSETLFSAPRVWASLYKICIDMFPPFGRLRIFRTSVPAEENQQKRPFVLKPNQPCQIIQNQHARFFQHTEAPRVEGAARIPRNCVSARHLADLASASSVFSHKGLTFWGLVECQWSKLPPLFPYKTDKTAWWLSLPLWKIWKPVGMMKFPKYGNIKHVPNHQAENMR